MQPSPGTRPDPLHAAAQDLRLEALVAENVELLADAGVEAIVLKGISFARLLYPEGGRVSGDVDLLVRHADIGRARAALAARGFVCVDEDGRLPASTNFASTFAQPTSVGVACFVDLHWNLHGSVVESERTWAVLSADTRELVVAGRRVQALSVAGCALHAALHAARSGLGGKRREDLRRAIRTIAVDDWTNATALARSIGLEDAFAAGLRLIPPGAELAARLDLTTRAPDPWRFPCARRVRGGERLRVVLVRRSPREAGQLIRTALLPGRNRAFHDARTTLGRRFVAAAYVEFWLRIAGNLPRALRIGWGQSRPAR